MANHKIIKLSLIFILFSTGCSNEKVLEKENNDIVNFPIDFYDIALNSVPGQPIVLTLKDATFLCSTEKGSFESNNNVNTIKVNSEETFYYCPIYKNNDSSVNVFEDSFIDIIIYSESNVIGYSIIKINYIKQFTWTPQLIKASLFIDNNENIINVDEEEVKNIISSFHN